MKTAKNTHVNPQDLKPTLETLLRFAKKHGADKADAITAHGRSLSIGVREGKLEDIDNSEGKDIGLRVFVGQRQACVSSSDLATESLETLSERAVAMAKLAPEDPYCGLATASTRADNSQDLDLFDPLQINPDALFERAKQLEQTALNGNNIQQAEGANAYASNSAVYFMTSDGFSQGWHASQHGLSVSAIASKDGAMERDYDYDSTCHFADLPAPEKIGLKAASRAAARLGAKQIKSGTMPILFERRVATHILSAFVNAICGPTITRGVSFLKDQMGAQVFGDTITITDDPLRLRSAGSHPWDGEGVRVRATDLIKDGMLQTWLLNTATANQLGLQTTGHASRGMSTPPGVASSNTYLHAGIQTPEALRKDMQNGLQITEMFGPSINPNTGDFSVGIAGFAIENGVLTHPVNEVTIAGNLKDMFAGLIPASDLELKQPMSAPSILIENMVVAGA